MISIQFADGLTGEYKISEVIAISKTIENMVNDTECENTTIAIPFEKRHFDRIYYKSSECEMARLVDYLDCQNSEIQLEVYTSAVKASIKAKNMNKAIEFLQICKNDIKCEFILEYLERQQKCDTYLSSDEPKKIAKALQYRHDTRALLHMFNETLDVEFYYAYLKTVSLTHGYFKLSQTTPTPLTNKLLEWRDYVDSLQECNTKQDIHKCICVCLNMVSKYPHNIFAYHTRVQHNRLIGNLRAETNMTLLTKGMDNGRLVHYNVGAVEASPFIDVVKQGSIKAIEFIVYADERKEVGFEHITDSGLEYCDNDVLISKLERKYDRLLFSFDKFMDLIRKLPAFSPKNMDRLNRIETKIRFGNLWLYEFGLK